MTEAEAAERWCPFAIVAFVGGAANRVDPIYQRMADDPKCGSEDAKYAREKIATTHCIGSRCMAWRWEPHFEYVEATAVARVPSDHGYCGLAGAPR